MKTDSLKSARRGATVFEVLLALSLFGLVALPLLKALTAMSETANQAKIELRMMSVLQSTLTQYARTPRIEPTERPIMSEPDDIGVWTETHIDEMNERTGKQLYTDESERGGRQPLQQMYHIRVIAHWEYEGERVESAADTYRYGPLYRPTGQ